MSKISNLDFAALTVSGDNYLKWRLDIDIGLGSKNISASIKPNNQCTDKQKCLAIQFMRHHLVEPLKDQYLSIRDPHELWQALEQRYNHQKDVSLPHADRDWNNLRFQDFKTVEEYNSALFSIVAILRLCGRDVPDKDLIEKTLSTMHPTHTILMQQYRQNNYTDFGKLIATLLLAEKQHELLMTNSAMRPPGTAAVPEANRTEQNNPEHREQRTGQNGYRGRGRGRGKFSGPRNGRGRRRGGYEPHDNRPNRNIGYGGGRGRGRGIQKPTQPTRGACTRCGMHNHWAKICRTPKHLADLYQKYQHKEAHTLRLDHDGEGDFDHEKDDLMETENSGFEISDVLK